MGIVVSIKEEEIDKKMTQVPFAGFFQKISYKSRWVLHQPASFNRLVHSFLFFAFIKEEQLQQQAKNGYWQNELLSLGIEPKEKKELNDKKNSKTFPTISSKQCFR